MILQSLKSGFLTFLAAVLLLLLIPVCVLWARSYFLTDDLHYHTSGRFTRFRTSGGGFWFETRPWSGNEQPGLNWQQFTDRALYPIAAGRSSPFLERCGFLYSTKDYDLLLVMPYWAVALPLFAALVMSPFLLRPQPRATEEDSHADG